MTWQTRSSLTPKVLSENQWQLHWLSVETESTHFQLAMQLYCRVRKKKKNTRGIGTVLLIEAVNIFPVVTILWVLSFCVTCVCHYTPIYAQDAMHHPIGDVANSKRPLLVIPKVQLRLRVTRRSATAIAR